ncbi:MAG TPA: transcription elongation factor GreA [Patescibacteria group bacterium]|nr:transcription elongation factor GreA [Patescibacteria group bacterium]
MNNKKVYVTSGGLEVLKKEYEELTKVKRPAIVDRVSAARDMGDLSENAEYSAAREELSFVDGRIEELEEMLKQVTLIEEEKRNGGAQVVALGSKVSLKIDGKNEDYTVVGEWEADPIAKKISHESPLGRALLGKKIGEMVEVAAPAGKVIYTVTSVQ